MGFSDICLNQSVVKEGVMFKIVRIKGVSVFLVFSLVFLYTPQLLRGKETAKGKGNLVGFIYGPDNTTPVEGAVFKIRHVSAVKEYESQGSDSRGKVELQGIEEGLYIVGITTPQGEYNFGNLIGIKANKTAKIAVSLRKQEQQAQAEQGQAVEVDKKCPKGKWYVPDIQGQCEEGYTWNSETERCECKKRDLLGFFLSPMGALTLLAASTGVVVTAFAVGGGDESASAFK
jgi:hypothetical protein